MPRPVFRLASRSLHVPGRLERSRGIALAIVLWFIAGMSLLVAGIVLSARTDARLAQIHLERAQATAAGDGAINLLLADVVEGRFDTSRAPGPGRGSGAGAGGEPAGNTAVGRGIYQVGDRGVAVIAVPTAWLIDINAADASLWTLALGLSGALSAEGARGLANAVVQWRQASARTGTRRFEALEDLLGVEGMNRTSWESVRDYVAIPRAGAGLFEADQRARDAMGRLQVLSPSRRLRAPDGLAPAQMLARGGRSGGAVRVDALIQFTGRSWLRRRWIAMSNTGSGLPWRVLRSEPARIVTPAVAGS